MNNLNGLKKKLYFHCPYFSFDLGMKCDLVFVLLTQKQARTKSRSLRADGKV